MTQSIIINSAEHKVGKTSNKPYMRFNTNIGWCSAFDRGLCDELANHVATGIPINVEIQEKPNPTNPAEPYRNINAMIGISEDKPISAKPADNKTFAKAPSNTPAQNDKFTTMYVSYAKDIFIGLMENKVYEKSDDCMTNAIRLVKQARDAFS